MIGIRFRFQIDTYVLLQNVINEASFKNKLYYSHHPRIITKDLCYGVISRLPVNETLFSIEQSRVRRVYIHRTFSETS